MGTFCDIARSVPIKRNEMKASAREKLMVRNFSIGNKGATATGFSY